jgi:hypothetical protein
MNINELTLGQIREIQSLALRASQTQAHPWEIGQHYAIRTVTMIQTGVIKAVYANEIVLTDACWIADTGRWHDFLKNPEGIAKEIEPFTDDVIVGRGGLIDAQKVPAFSKRVQK